MRGPARPGSCPQVEFVRFGQGLKVDTIERGDAPTSLATSGLFKRAPWEPMCFYPDFSQEVACGDSWGDSKLVVATEQGVFVVNNDEHAGGPGKQQRGKGRGFGFDPR